MRFWPRTGPSAGPRTGPSTGPSAGTRIDVRVRATGIRPAHERGSAAASRAAFELGDAVPIFQ